MKKYLCYLPLLLSVSICQSCKKDANPVATTDTLVLGTPVAMALTPLVSEISGIVDSKANPGYLWAQEDSGNPPNLILISHNGNVLKSLHLRNATNRDWEDIAIAGDQLYIADIGDNNQVYPDYTIYQFTEPTASIDTIGTYANIRFRYPDGSHDAEAFLVDPVTKDIYIITKRDNPSKVYKLAYPQSLTTLNTAVNVGNLTYSGVVSATLAADGKNIIVKTYTGLFLYQHKQNKSLAESLSGSYTQLSYQLEPQGEAVTFAANNSGIYTLSEKGLANGVNLYFYQKK